MPPAPKKPAHKRKLSTGHHTRPIEQETAGKLYLVRDKDYGDGQPVLWGFDLRYPDAQKLKECVAAKRLSTTVRFEEQTDETAHYLGLAVDARSPWLPFHVSGTGSGPRPLAMDPAIVAQQAMSQNADQRRAAIGNVVFSDPGIVAAQGAAIGAVSGIVADANRRQAEAKAKREVQAVMMAPPPMPEIPSEEELAKMIAEGGEEMDADELAELMGGETDADDIAAAQAMVADGKLTPPVNILEAALKVACPRCNAAPDVACVDSAGPITHQERCQLGRASEPGVTVRIMVEIPEDAVVPLLWKVTGERAPDGRQEVELKVPQTDMLRVACPTCHAAASAACVNVPVPGHTERAHAFIDTIE